ncbi:12944_t:CDS:2 [Ambispora gerdemannii]|uniref:12944_t:CDS:1 n=1 Tax=Ambispora gerdemannii TaxID=144530 RepID=A0A9N8VN82_9GLOM|nr:12944_t:CDS:2 [Ambispora gerdemannii]
MENQEIIIIALVIIAIYLYCCYYGHLKSDISYLTQYNNTLDELSELKSQLEHCQTLYQKRVAKDLDAETLNSKQKITDLETALLNLAQQKLKDKKEAQELLNQNQEPEPATKPKLFDQAQATFTELQETVNQAYFIKGKSDVKQKLEELDSFFEQDLEVIEKDKQELTKQLQGQSQVFNEQLRKINVLFDKNAENYQTIDFNGLYSLLANIQQEREQKKQNKETGTQTADPEEKELENTVDNLLKEIKELQKLSQSQTITETNHKLELTLKENTENEKGNSSDKNLMRREQIITEWNNLQAKLNGVKYLHQQKALIKDAIEFHLQQASYFTTEHSNEPLLNRRLMEQEKERLTDELEKLIQQPTELRARDPDYFESEKEKIRKELTKLEVALTESSTAQTAFNRQKVKYEQIVKDCRELLAKL